MPEPSESKQRVELLSISVPDYPRVARFLDRLHKPIGEQLWIKRFQHWWDQNPASLEGQPKGWVLQLETEVVGFIGVIPTWMTSAGQKLLVYSLTTWVVSPEHRNESIRLFMEAHKLAREHLIFNTSATDEMITFMKRFKYEQYLAGEHLRALVAVLHPTAAGWFKLFGEPAPAMLHPIDRLLLPFAGVPKSSNQDYSFRSVSTTEMEALWKKAGSQCGLTNVRDAKTAQWWLNAPGDIVSAFGVFSKAMDAPLAVAFFIQLDRAIQVWECIDYFEDRSLDVPEQSAVRSTAVAGAVAHAKKQLKHVSAVSFPKHSGLFHKMPGLRETRRSNNNKLCFSRNADLMAQVKSDAYLTNQGDMYL